MNTSKRIFSFAAALCCLLALFALSGCQSSEKSKITVELETNPTTGYDWTAETQGEVKFIGSETASSESSSDLDGAPQQRRYIFEPQAEGDLTVVFTYKRDWEGGESAYSVTYKFTVDKNLKATFVSKTPKAIDGSLEGVEFPDPVME